MSASLTRKLLKEVFRVADSSKVRKELSKQQHLTTVTYDNLKEAYKDSYIALTQKDPSLPDPKGWKTFDSAAKEALKRLKKHANPSSRTRSYEMPYTLNKTNEITYRSPKNSQVPLNIIKNTGVAYINTKLKEYQTNLSTRQNEIAKGVNPKAAASVSQIGQYKAKIETHHKQTTIGAAQLAKSLSFLGTTKYFSKFMESEELKNLRDIFGDFDTLFEVDTTDFVVSIKEDASITVDIGSFKKNFAGSEPNDWKQISQGLQDAIQKWAEKQDWWGRKGSPSPKEDGIKLVEHKIVTALSKVKGAKVQRKTSLPKRKPKKTSQSFASSSKRKRKTTKARSYTGGVKKGVSSAPLQLIALLNRDLPRVVSKNMQAPGLENRTGRFASSVKVTDVIQTPQGFPSVGYTYMKNPYQTFEPGFAQGDPNRDPRKVIDQSIREIAAQYAIGRFYTRRV